MEPRREGRRLAGPGKPAGGRRSIRRSVRRGRVRRGAPLRRPVAPPAAARGHNSTDQQDAVRAWVRLIAVHKRALGALRDDLEPDMTVARFELLVALAQQDGQSLASLARATERPAVNLRGLVARAARDGLVERRAGAPDRRSFCVHITPKGRRALHDAERRHARRIVQLFETLSRSEVTLLA